jgi:hypothetical protein
MIMYHKKKIKKEKKKMKTLELNHRVKFKKWGMFLKYGENTKKSTEF